MDLRFHLMIQRILQLFFGGRADAIFLFTIGKELLLQLFGDFPGLKMPWAEGKFNVQLFISLFQTDSVGNLPYKIPAQLSFHVIDRLHLCFHLHTSCAI